ncbi:MAG TPA: M48 family metalloprotease [Vitreimonas sp.]|uniref:M48 family metalloprotease n=1 Tax=Vitreimonas sp. TaxID=3069702 RepID=UPI002D53CB62|nr:M48 family metalloprotease [Vitreimonas sp.]HYD88396.1 M48 family metalloprotease [Vitreimonas sp.]
MAASLIKALGRQLAAVTIALSVLIMAAPQAAAQGLIRDAEIENTLRVYTDPLLQAAGLEPRDVDIYIVSDPSVNAFVAGGQNIFVHTGLILAADTPNEVIGVLAHETGHISGGHGARRAQDVQRAIGPMLLSIGLGVLAIAAGAPDAGAALISGSQAFAMGDIVRHTQVQESSADQAGLQFLEATGQSGRGLITFFNTQIRPYEFMTRRAPAWMMTHPFSSDRVEALRERVQNSPNYNATDTPENIRRFQFMQAKLVGFIHTQGQTLARYPLRDTSQPARYARAVAYYRVSDLTRARAELESLMREDPSNPYFQELMGQILFENGRAAESIPYHRRSLELAPNQPLLQINLARALTAANGRAGADEAIALLQAATAREPDNAFAWRELASARDLRGEQGLAELASAEQNFALGDYGAALSFAERARRSLPRNTPSYQRANDIVTFAGNEMRDREGQQRGRRS